MSRRGAKFYLWSLLAAVAAVPGDAAQPPAETQCPAPRGRESSADDPPPPAGIPLILGVQTGMTREEVRQISSWLTSRYASRTFELVPGVNLRATVGFEGSPERASYGYMHGGGPRARVITALTRRYGPPQVLDRSVRYNNALVSNPGGITIEDSVSVRWCDGLRIFHLSGENHDFNVTITAAPAAGSAEPAVSQGSE